MAFRFNEASTGNIAAFAEDYRVVKTPGGCHLTWVMAMKPKGVAARLGMSLGRPVMAWTFQKFCTTCATTAPSGTPSPDSARDGRETYVL
jgi:hypothetical protein